MRFALRNPEGWMAEIEKNSRWLGGRIKRHKQRSEAQDQAWLIVKPWSVMVLRVRGGDYESLTWQARKA